MLCHMSDILDLILGTTWIFRALWHGRSNKCASVSMVCVNMCVYLCVEGYGTVAPEQHKIEVQLP